MTAPLLPSQSGLFFVLLLSQAVAFAVHTPGILASTSANSLRPFTPSLMRASGPLQLRPWGLRAPVHRTRPGTLMTSLSGGGGDCLAVFVYVSCKPGTEEAFKAASLDNAKNSVQEEGVARFDCVQNMDDPTKFVLVEVYKNADAPAKHKETAHYATWRDTVADMMAEPRKAVKYSNVFPATAAGWDVPAELGKGAPDGSRADLLAVHVFVHCKEGTEDAFIEASLNNAMNSVKEPGIARFDVLRNQDEPKKFMLLEVYRSADAPADHKKTAHYNTWRETVADMMAEDRSALKYSNCFPAADENWKMASL